MKETQYNTWYARAEIEDGAVYMNMPIDLVDILQIKENEIIKIEKLDDYRILFTKTNFIYNPEEVSK